MRVIIVDDERPARNFLRTMLERQGGIELVGEASNGADAVELIRELKPDLALLDLQMPELNGFEVVRSQQLDELPLIAFVTAYDEYAVQAFEVNAVDYLLKPVDPERLADTIRRARERLPVPSDRERISERVIRAVEKYEDAESRVFIDRIPVKLRDEIVLVPVREIVSVVADGELLHIKTFEGQRYIINHRLKDLESKLDPSAFVRLSRGAIVNLEAIEKISPVPGGTYLVLLANGQEIPASRSQSRLLRERFLKI